MAFVYSSNSIILFIVSCFINCTFFLMLWMPFLCKAWVLLLHNQSKNYVHVIWLYILEVCVHILLSKLALFRILYNLSKCLYTQYTLKKYIYLHICFRLTPAYSMVVGSKCLCPSLSYWLVGYTSCDFIVRILNVELLSIKQVNQLSHFCISSTTY